MDLETICTYVAQYEIWRIPTITPPQQLSKQQYGGTCITWMALVIRVFRGPTPNQPFPLV